tara:strand:+ start:22642 stop:22881 length:240 start_codon:yes stop_codon:yes gene_type:complete
MHNRTRKKQYEKKMDISQNRLIQLTKNTIERSNKMKLQENLIKQERNKAKLFESEKQTKDETIQTLQKEIKRMHKQMEV